MNLVEINYGALASSEVINNNFNYLDNKISDLSENIVAQNSSNNSKFANINLSIQSTNEKIDTVKNGSDNLSNFINQINNSSLRMPNYYAGIGIGSGGVAPTNGYILFIGERICVNGCYGNINGNRVISGDGQLGYWLDSNSIMCPVSQGDIVHYYGFSCIFYPMKGVA